MSRKTDYTKAEESISETMHQMNVKQLLHEADLASASNPAKTQAGNPEQAKQNHLCFSLKRDLKLLAKKDQNVYTSIGYKKKEINNLLKDASQLSPEDWEKLKQIKQSIEKYKQDLARLLPHKTDEEQVEEERNKHINKRFNVSDKWLPLDTKSKV